MLKLLVVAAICCLASAKAVKFKDCGSKGSKIASVDITPCPEEPCQLERNTNVNVTVTFTASEETTKATTKVYGVIGGIPIYFPLPNDACKNMTCPTAPGKQAIYKNSIFVKPIYPKVTLVVKWEVEDEKSGMFFCFEVPAQITG